MAAEFRRRRPALGIVTVILLFDITIVRALVSMLNELQVDDEGAVTMRTVSFTRGVAGWTMMSPRLTCALAFIANEAAIPRAARVRR